MSKGSKANPYKLPAEPFRSRLLEWEQRAGFDPEPTSGNEDRGGAGKPWAKLMPREYLATHMRCSRSYLDKLAEGEFQFIRFDKADALMCAMNLAHEWWTDPEFRSIYIDVDLEKLDREYPTRRPQSGGSRMTFPHGVAIDLYKAGVPVREIVSRVGAPSEQAVLQLISRLGLANRRNTVNLDEAMRLHAEGFTWAQVAEQLGAKTNTVKMAIWRMRQREKLEEYRKVRDAA